MLYTITRLKTERIPLIKSIYTQYDISSFADQWEEEPALVSKTDLSGREFGRLKVLNLEKKHNHHLIWKTVCDCGDTRLVRTASLNSGAVTQCSGCTRVSINPKRLWTFSDSSQHQSSLVNLLEGGPKTSYQLKGELKTSLDKTMDSLAVLLDQGRIKVRYSKTGDRLYYLGKEEEEEEKGYRQTSH